MATKDGYPIISEDYADLLIESSKTKAISEIYPDALIHPINFLLSLVNVPVNFITNYTVQHLGYSVFPAILGLISYASLEASGIQKLRNIPNHNFRGQGVLIAVIDTGIDYTNPIFRYADGTTRIAAIWDQTLQSGNPPKGFLYGSEYTKEQINLALQSETPYKFVPSKDEIGHGTMVAGIAGGKESMENNFYGAAPDAEFIIVKLKPAKKYLKKFFCIPENAIGYQENDVAFALNYVLNELTVSSRPIAVCLAINSSEGAHDGRGTLNDYISFLARVPGIAIVVGAGNEGNAGRHYFGIVSEITGLDTLQLKVGDSEKNFSMELYGDVPSIFSLDIISPSGEIITIITPVMDEFRELLFPYQNTTIYLDYQMVESQTGIQLIFFRFINPAPGIWQFTINKKSDINLSFHIWLPMKGFISDRTYFIRPDPYTTVLSLANTTTTITATAYNTADDSLYPNAGKGYSRVGGITPDIAAPGVDVIGPTLYHSFVAYTGTSVSAAHMTGVAAMLLEWGIVRGNFSNMSSVEIKNLVNAGARRNINLTYPNRDWGYGILDIYNIFTFLK
ncbi:MAG: S8 family peptidase [Anaerocolumna sp.]